MASRRWQSRVRRCTAAPVATPVRRRASVAVAVWGVTAVVLVLPGTIGRPRRRRAPYAPSDGRRPGFPLPRAKLPCMPTLRPTRDDARHRIVHVPAAHAGQFLAPSQVIFSPETKLQYRIERCWRRRLRTAYLATRRGRSATVPEQVCIKVSARIDAGCARLLRLLLHGHPRAVQVFDRFPRCARRPGALLPGAGVRLSRRLSAHLQQGRTWTEAAARREIAGILECSASCTAAAPARDLTPMNVFVCEGRKLKLGDFASSAAERSARRHGRHDERVDGAERHPRQHGAEVADARDVYQVGQLLACW